MDACMYILKIMDTRCRKISVRTFDLGLQIVRNLAEIELKGEFGLKNEDSMVVADIYCPLALMEA